MANKSSKKAKELEKQLKAIQQSTKTTFGAVLPIHDKLRHQSKWYYKWHTNSWANAIHIALVFLFIGLIATATVYSLSGQVLTAKAATEIHVATTGTDDGDCGPIGDPCLTIQYAVDKISGGDTVTVHTGVYLGPKATEGRPYPC